MKKGRGGFTILELLVVVSVIAILATLSTGAALKSIRRGREKRVETMRMALEMAITTYRAQNGEWPFDLKDIKLEDRKSGAEGKKEWKGKENEKVFSKLYEKGGASGGYLDCSGFFTDEIDKKGRRRLRLSEVPEGKRKNLPLGYPDPDDQNNFKYFTVTYFPVTDRVKVSK